MSTIFRDIVTVDGFTFNNNESIDGCKYNIDIFDGWKTGPTPRVEMAEYGFSDGVALSDRFPFKEKYYSIGGWNLATDRGSAERSLVTLSNAFKGNVNRLITRNGPVPKAIRARQSAPIEVTDDIEIGYRWLVQMISDWPFKIGPTAKSFTAGVFSGSDPYRTYTDSGSYPRPYVNSSPYYRTYTDPLPASGLPTSLVLNNEGNANDYPIVTILGPLPARVWALTNDTTGDVTTFELDLAYGQELVIDNLKKTAMIGDQHYEYYLRGGWMRLAPGINSVRVITAEDNADARVTVTYRDTWEI